MKHSDRVRLHFGPYLPPRCRVGGHALDVRFGRVQIVGIRECRISWPEIRRGRARSLLLSASLVRAVRRESSQAIQHWWGVSPSMVWKWRRAVGASADTEGRHQLRLAYGQEPFFRRAQRLAVAKAQDPERCAKIAEAKRGKRRSPETVAKVRRALLRRPLSAEHRRKLSEVHRGRGTRPPAAGPAWAPWEDALLAMDSAEVQRQTGRSAGAVYRRRLVLGLPTGRRSRHSTRQSEANR